MLNAFKLRIRKVAGRFWGSKPSPAATTRPPVQSAKMGETPATTSSSTPEPPSPVADHKLVTLEERAVDQARPIKVIVIGAGISGILAGARLPQKIANLDLTIYEKNSDVGGTWFENRYPGIACGE